MSCIRPPVGTRLLTTALLLLASPIPPSVISPISTLFTKGNAFHFCTIQSKALPISFAGFNNFNKFQKLLQPRFRFSIPLLINSKKLPAHLLLLSHSTEACHAFLSDPNL